MGKGKDDWVTSVAVLGYGSQGRAVALNLKDSGCNVVVGLRSGSAARDRAAEDGLRQMESIRDAVSRARIVCFAFPDHRHRRVYRQEIEPHLRPGSFLWFLHGLSVHFGFVAPPTDSDVCLLAPHAPGLVVREEYLGERRVSAFYAVHQDVSGRAESTLFELAAAFGITKERLLPTTFEHEAVGDLFGEQTVLCGGMAALIKGGFEVLVENGLSPESAYLEVAYQLDHIVGLIKRFGVDGMLERISVAARLGALEQGPAIIDASVKQRMQRAFDRIRSGRFTDRLSRMTSEELSDLNKHLGDLTDPRLDDAARKLAARIRGSSNDR